MTPDAWTYCRLNLGTELLSPPFVWVCVETIYRGGFIFDITAVAMTKLFFCLGNASIEELLALFVRPVLLLVIKSGGNNCPKACWHFFFGTCQSHCLKVNTCQTCANFTQLISEL